MEGIPDLILLSKSTRYQHVFPCPFIQEMTLKKKTSLGFIIIVNVRFLNLTKKETLKKTNKPK